MSLLAKVGQFAHPAAAGNQAITGVGFQPKAIIFWSVGYGTMGTWTGNHYSHFGICAGVGKEYSVCAAADDGLSTTRTGRLNAAASIYKSVGDQTNRNQANLVSFDADGFTLNWISNAGSISVWGGHQIFYLALGGTDITNANVVSWTLPAATGAKAITGVGFKPDLVVNISCILNALPSSSGTEVISIGACNKHGQQFSLTNGSSGSASASNNTRDRTLQMDACDLDSNAAVGLNSQMHFQSMDTDGFTVNVSQTLSGYYVMSLCLKGVTSKIGSFLTYAGGVNGTVQTVDRVGFTPKALLLAHINSIPQAGPIGSAYMGIGASDGTTQRMTEKTDDQANNPTKVKHLQRNDAIYNRTNSPGNPDHYCSMSGFTADGFQLTWTAAMTGIHECAYLALGDTGVNTFPSTVAV